MRRLLLTLGMLLTINVTALPQQLETVFSSPVAIFVAPDSLEIDALKREMGTEGFYTAADDENWYRSLAFDMLDSRQIPIASIPKGVARFVVDDRVRTVDISREPGWFVLLYDGRRLPLTTRSVDLPDVIEWFENEGDAGPQPDRGREAVEQVRAAEIAFARTMADRDLETFATFLDEEAVFVGRRATMRGREAILEGWGPFFEGEEAPFSWAPQTVEVLDSGTLALTAGPVLGPGGESLGTFNSVWRRGDDGRWRVIFDKGCPPCEKD